MKIQEFLSHRCQRGLVLVLAAASLACAPAGRMGEEIHIAEESAIIIWDAALKTQHFIRRASFETKAKDFGFLVPTPTVPKLEEADDNAFDHLKRITAPTVRAFDPQVKSELPKPATAAPAAAVIVVAKAKVAGYDVVVLEANDAAALNRWLKDHDYASSQELEEWFKPYISRGWKISAFKIATDSPGGSEVSSKAVRMSFATEEPFFPYREPATAQSGKAGGKPRLLRVYFLSDVRYDGALGGGAWPGKTVWSGKLQYGLPALMDMIKLPIVSAADATWLTEFEDRSSPRPGTDDVFFKASADQAEVRRPDIVYGAPGFGGSGGFSWSVLLSILAIAGAALWLFLSLLKRAERNSPPPDPK